MTREEIMQLNTDYLNGCESEHKMNELFSYALEQQPCGDAISRQAVLDINFKRIILTTAKPAETIEQKVKALPSVTRQTGEWIRWYEVVEHEKSTEHIPHCKCSVCNREQDPHSAKFINFCPNCGAKMVEPQESEE